MSLTGTPSTKPTSASFPYRTQVIMSLAETRCKCPYLHLLSAPLDVSQLWPGAPAGADGSCVCFYCEHFSVMAMASARLRLLYFSKPLTSRWGYSQRLLPADRIEQLLLLITSWPPRQRRYRQTERERKGDATLTLFLTMYTFVKEESNKVERISSQHTVTDAR